MKKILFTITVQCLVALTLKAQVVTVSVLAGAGTLGTTDGTGATASFNFPTGVCSDATGNIYVADQSNHKIRKITPAGVVSTFAGTGAIGSTDGAGAIASFNYPNEVCADAAGNIYVADYFNHKIRKITPTGFVSTFAGTGTSGSADGTGATASFSYPAGVFADAAGNIYVADYNNNKIRKITVGGVVSTFAGTGTSGSADGPVATASFNNPGGICMDAAGNIYVTDYSNHKIRKITSAGIVSTLAGTGTAGATDGAGATASFYLPNGVCVDAVGNIYVADQSNHKIRKITPAGVVSTLAGTGTIGSTDGTGATSSFYYPVSICTDAVGNIYVADQSNHKIRKITILSSASALNFDATAPGDNVVLPAAINTTLSTLNKITVEAWVKPSSLSGTGCIIGNYNTPSNQMQFLIRRGGSSNYEFFIGNSSVGGYINVNSIASPTLNIWQHVALTWNGTVATCYINGVVSGSVSVTYSNMGVTTNSLIIGGNSTNENFAGDIDEVRIWTRTLCQGEIQNNMNGEIATTGTNLLTNYHFNQGFASAPNPTVTSLTDASGNAYTGTLTGIALTGVTSNWVAPGAVTTGSTVTAFVSPTIAIAGTSTICAGSSTTLTASGTVAFYTWVSGPITATNVVSPTVNTTYSVIGTNSLGCQSNMAMQTVTVNALPIVTAATSSTLICTGQTATLSVGGALSYTLLPGSTSGTSFTVSPTSSTTYTVYGTNAMGCSNVTSVSQSVSPCTSINNLTSNHNVLSIYPNPSNGIFNTNVTSTTKVIIVNVLGKVVYTQTLEVGTHQINLSTFANGLYVLKAENNGALNTMRLIKE